MAPPTQVPDQSQNQIPQQGGPDHDLSQDELTAVLGYITTIGENQMKSDNAAASPQTAPQQEQTPPPQEDLKPQLTHLQTQINGIPDLVKTEIKQAMDGMTKMIQDALKEEDSHEQK